jgi:hypothetical protein
LPACVGMTRKAAACAGMTDGCVRNPRPDAYCNTGEAK